MSVSPAPEPGKKTGSLVPQKHGEEWYAKLASSYLIFLIVTAIVLAFVTAIFITNTVYYDKINKNKGCSGAVTESEANILFWLNLILAVISGIFFLAAVVLAFIQFEEPKWTEKYIGRISYTPGTVAAARAAAVQPYVQKRVVQAGRAGGAELQRRAKQVQAEAARLPGRVRGAYDGFRRPELQEALGNPSPLLAGYRVRNIPSYKSKSTQYFEARDTARDTY